MRHPVEFQEILPLDGETVARQTAVSLARGLPEADGADLPLLRVIANGPSARRAPLEGPTLALNGALRLFQTPPTYWACCDPQELVADFLTDAPEETIYLVASKCHDAVFDALEGKDVRIWHVGPTPGRRWVRTASSVTICAIELMRRLGWRRFETWGWDGCYMDGQDHAVGQHHERHEIEVSVGAILDDAGVPKGGRSFKTTPTWALEAQDAAIVLSTADYEISVRGGGMIGEHLRCCGVPALIGTDQ